MTNKVQMKNIQMDWNLATGNEIKGMEPLRFTVPSSGK